jgi:cytoskeletal protein RodZ
LSNIIFSQTAKVYPEFEIYRRVGYWPIRGFVYLILRTGADQYKKRINPNKVSKAGKKKRQQSTSPKVEESTTTSVKPPSGGESGNNTIDSERASERASEQHADKEDAGEQQVRDKTANNKSGHVEIVKQPLVQPAKGRSLSDTLDGDLTMGSDLEVTIDEVIEGVSGMLLDHSSIRMDMSSIIISGKSHSNLHICAD